MNHLTRELAPITDQAWTQIDDEASRSLKHYLAARRLVDFTGPLGWGYSAVDTGRIDTLDGGPLGGVDAARRKVLTLVELRSPFTLDRAELAAADRGPPTSTSHGHRRRAGRGPCRGPPGVPWL